MKISMITWFLLLTSFLSYLLIDGDSQSSAVDLEKKEKITLSDSPFGVSFGSVYRGESFMNFIAELGINSTKLYIYWRQIEPQKGKYDWEILERFLGQLPANSGSLIAVWSSSSWGTKSRQRIRGGAPPRDLEAYHDFVFKLVRHCKGKIKYWQNDCEPNSPVFWEGTKEEFVSTLEVFHKAVKGADPTASVVVGGHSGFFTDRGTPDNQSFFDYVFREGKDFFDLFDIRLYGDPYTIPYRMEWFQKRMAEFDCHKPIVSTEYGGPLPTQFPEGQEIRRKYFQSRSRKEQIETFNKMLEKRHLLPPQMRMFLEDCESDLEEKRHRIHSRDIVIRTLLALSAGVEKLWYWNLVNEPHPLFGKFRLMNTDLTVKYPAFYVYQRMMATMKDAASIRQRVIQSRPDIYLFEIVRKHRDPVYVIWEKRDLFSGEDQTPTHFELTFEFEHAKISDIFGVEKRDATKGGMLPLNVTETPLFIERDERN